MNPDDPDSFDDGHGYLTIAEDIYGHKKLAHEEKQEVCVSASCSCIDFHYHGGFCTAGCPCMKNTRAEADS